jgi:hypothetical protein
MQILKKQLLSDLQIAKMTQSRDQGRARDSPGAVDNERIPALVVLPVELRTVIWDIVLIEDAAISMVSSYRPPPLQETNRQTRDEAITTYYSCNVFKLRIEDFIVKPIVPAMAAISKYHDPPGSIDPNQVGIAFHFVGECNWANLRYWIKAVYYEEADGLMHAENVDEVGLALVGLFSVVEGLVESGASWQQVKSALLGRRKMMGPLEEDWLVD